MSPFLHPPSCLHFLCPTRDHLDGSTSDCTEMHLIQPCDNFQPPDPSIQISLSKTQHVTVYTLFHTKDVTNRDGCTPGHKLPAPAPLAYLTFSCAIYTAPHRPVQPIFVTIFRRPHHLLFLQNEKAPPTNSSSPSNISSPPTYLTRSSRRHRRPITLQVIRPRRTWHPPIEDISFRSNNALVTDYAVWYPPFDRDVIGAVTLDV